jgi:membrane protease YdiL (CAAX protease family)
VLALGFGLTLLLARYAGVQPVHPIIEEAGHGFRRNMQLYLLACGLAPMVEETMFRGFLYHWLRPRIGYFAAAALTGILFAAIHPQGWTTIPALGAIGFVLASIREWRNTLLAPMAAHALNNFVAVTFLVVALG